MTPTDQHTRLKHWSCRQQLKHAIKTTQSLSGSPLKRCGHYLNSMASNQPSPQIRDCYALSALALKFFCRS